MEKVIPHTLFSDFDVSLFKSGSHYNLFEKFGSHIIELNGTKGTYFAVWAPAAKNVAVVGNFNYWNGYEHSLFVRWDSSGIWEGFIPNLTHGELYKFEIETEAGYKLQKADPYARFTELPPKTASIIQQKSNYQWNDVHWMNYRKDKNALDKPFAVYEVHLESWKKKEDNQNLSFRELAVDLVNYVKEMHYTHVEFMPIMEYPYSPSWGYQITGYYATSSRFGNTDDLKFLIDTFHQNDIGVILDWVPSHFPEDDHGLGNFDGSNVYEHPDPKKGYHPDWKSLIFNYERNEVVAFLISNAIYWLQEFHVDGLRVDAVASMLYLNYSREEDQWEPNEFGGKENLAAISFIKKFNNEIKARFGNQVQTIAEESTAFTGVTTATEYGGLGFGMKWMMGWMNDSLEYFSKEPIHRKYHHNEITFSLTYAFSERFMLPLSHDEVVYGKQSLVYKMPGNDWLRYANLRCLLTYMYMHPGSKLTFMGAEFGQTSEWNFQQSLDWHLLEYEPHSKTQEFMKELNKFYVNEPALYEKAYSPEGFEWITYSDYESSVMAFVRKGHDYYNDLIVVCNFTDVYRENYTIGVHTKNNLKCVFNSDSKNFYGSGSKIDAEIKVNNFEYHNKKQSININLPPLSVTVYKQQIN